MNDAADIDLASPETADSGDNFGRIVASAGDVNGDGYDDVIVGCTGCDGNATDAGDAFIYFGGSTMNDAADINLASPETADLNDYFGFAVASAGDVNADGYADVIVGCYQCDGNGANAGDAFIYFGGSTMNDAADIDLASPETAD